MPVRRDTRRRFEQFVRNPDCEANVISAVAGVPMDKVTVAEGGDPTVGQSPFALARGTTFEAALLRDEAARLRIALQEAGVLDEHASGFLDLRLRLTGGPIQKLDEAVGRTHELLETAAQARGRGRRNLPAIVAGAALKVPGQPVMLPDGVVAIDALVISKPTDDAVADLRIGEIKTYPDRAGYTDPDDLATARAQAGVYRHALLLVLKEAGLERGVTCNPKGFLVLSRAGSNEPAVHANEDLEFLTARAARGFERLRAAAAGVTEFDPENEGQGFKAVREAPTHYTERCLQFCDRAALCRERAAATGDPAVLGDDVVRFLGGASLPRALELLEGARPKGAAEKDLVRRMAEAGVGAPA